MDKLVVVDNYDSFTYNLVQMFMAFDLEIRVFRSDAVSVDEILRLAPDYILISPGPKDPRAAGISMALIRQCYRTIPILGVCLGMQCINEVFGGKTLRCETPMHGKTSRVMHDQKGLFAGLPPSFRAARYHSLKIEPSDAALENELMITARTEDNIIMGISHRCFPLHGVQFHPESFLTEHGFALVKNFLGCKPQPHCVESANEIMLDLNPPRLPIYPNGATEIAHGLR